VELIFSTGHYSSKTRKSAQILCNAAGNIPRLTLAVEIVPNPDSIGVFQVRPALLDLDKERPQDQKRPWQYEFTVKNVSTEDLKFTIVSRPDKFVEVDFPENKKVSAGGEKTFKLKFDQSMADDLFNKSVTIEASDSTHTRFTLPISKARRWGPAPTSER
jgi:hypothetical protein